LPALARNYCSAVISGLDAVADIGIRFGYARRIVPIVALILSIIVVSAAQADERFITLSSTTSAQDSGLLGYILPIFKAVTSLSIHVVAVGTGQALARGQRGEADALLVHDRVGEDKFVAQGRTGDHRVAAMDDYRPGPSPTTTNDAATKAKCTGQSCHLNRESFVTVVVVFA